MATPGRSQDPDVNRPIIEAMLRGNPARFDFFQAVRLLVRIQRDRQPVGRFASPDREAIRFGVHNSLRFPTSQIEKMEWESGEPPRMLVNFMGLTGPMGILPYGYTELVIERNRTRDRSLEAFLDIFNHRLISLFYQAWEKYRFPVAYERTQDDRFSQHLMALLGLGTPGLQKRQPVPDEALLYYTGLLSLQPRSAAALEQILEDYFDVPVEVEQFVGGWHILDASDQCCFEDADTYSEQLGSGAVVGDEIWDHQSRARVSIGPLTSEEYLDFLPSGRGHEPLKALMRFFSNGEIEFEIRLILKRDDVPHCELGVDGEESPRLGWFSWMKSRPSFDRNPGDTILLMS
ncbi:MAG: type VI secretion system baseplate subunit TssG [Bryobacteraceae bacterium]